MIIARTGWKGNVRELRNVVERLLIMTDRDRIEQKDLPEQIIGEHRVYLPEPDKAKSLKDFRDLAEKDFILAKLEQNNWSLTATPGDPGESATEKTPPVRARMKVPSRAMISPDNLHPGPLVCP